MKSYCGQRLNINLVRARKAGFSEDDDIYNTLTAQRCEIYWLLNKVLTTSIGTHVTRKHYMPDHQVTICGRGFAFS